MQWFGKSWGAAICEPAEHIATPIGKQCAWCDEVFVGGEQGVRIPALGAAGDEGADHHLDCFLRSVIGSLAHLQHECSCFVPGATCTDPPELSKREAAQAAVRYWRQQSCQRGENPARLQ